MPLNTVDAYGNPVVIPFGATNPPPNPTSDDTPYFRENKSYPSWLFQENGGINRNLLMMLAGMGAEMDPRGAGGILGRGTQWYVQAEAGQDAYKAQQASTNEHNRRLFEIMAEGGGLTPKGKAGFTKVEAKPDGQVNFVGNITDDIPDTSGANVRPATPETTAPSGTPIPTDTAPDGTPINPIGYKSTINPRLKEQLDNIPVPTVPRPGNRPPAQAPIRPGDALAASQTDTTVNPYSTGLPVNRKPVTEAPETLPVMQVTAPRYNEPVIQNAQASVAPVNTAALLPTPRKRSQTMFDLRNIIPF